jgi:hypothetical protein
MWILFWSDGCIDDVFKYLLAQSLWSAQVNTLPSLINKVHISTCGMSIFAVTTTYTITNIYWL